MANPFLGIASAGVTPAGDDCASGNLIFSWHMEDLTVTSGTPAGCSDTDTSVELVSLATLSSAVAQDGTESLNCSTSGDYAWVDGVDVDPTQGTVEFYIYWNTLNSGVNLWAASKDGSNYILIESRPGGTIRINHVVGGVTTQTLGTGAMTTGVWYKVTGKWRSTGNPNLSIQVDAATAVTSDTELTPITGPFGKIEMGNGGSTGSYNYNLDNIRVWNTWQ